MIKTFSITTLVFLLFTFTFSAFAQNESRASKTWEVQRYDIAATLPQTETDRNLIVKATLNLRNASGAAASTLTLRISPNAEVSAVRINDAAVDFTRGEEKIDEARKLQRIVVRVPTIQPNATFNAAVDYKLSVKENSGLNELSPVGAQFLPLAFWYPTPNSWYFARGADYAPVRLQVNSSAGGETAIASGTETGNSFEQKLNGQPFFVAGNWDKIDASGVSVFVSKGADANAQKRAGELAALASDAKNFAATLLGNAPDAPIKIVAVRRGAGFADGGTILIDENFFRRQKIDSLTAMNVAEGVAKIWIGGAVKISDGQGAIREGLARFIANEFLEKQFGKDIADIERLRQRTAYAAVVRRDAPLTIASPLDDFYYAEAANKGAMIWRLLAKRVGRDEFFKTLREQMKDGSLDLNELRSAFAAQKNFLDYSFDEVTDTNLLIGLPQLNGAETKMALRNLGAIDAVAVNITATTASGEKLTAQSTIPAKSFGEISFKTTAKIVRAEIDTDKFYPQTDYSDDVAPREFNESDFIAAIKKNFDKQDYAATEKNARTILNVYPRFDDARIWLGRALLAQGKIADSEREFKAALDEKLPTPRTLAWGNEGLGETALRNGQATQATQFLNEAIRANAEYGASLAARASASKIVSAVSDESVKSFFAQFDKAAVSGRKADVDALISTGEIPKFSGGVSGQAQQWNTKVTRVDQLDANTVLAEVSLNIKLINKEPSSGTAVFLLSKIGGNWKLSGVESFEVK